MPRVACCPNVREAVLQAARLLMERYGYKKMTIDDIASEVGIGKATLYGYFERKQDVALAVIDEYHQELQANWQNIAASDLTPSEKLRKMILERVTYLFDISQRYRQSLDDCLAALRPLVLSRRDSYNESESAIMAQVIKEGVEKSVFQCSEPEAVARIIFSCTSGLMPLNLSAKELDSRDRVIEKTEQVTDLVLRSLRPSCGAHQ